ncbi:hypothetical protein SLS62_004251 [Diatrype stigma]|uniref:DUF7726 domain-containing protein n=1 Tax=Diatrype stigma TaxID=117547 RepID=A0AAN9URT6_9PEZI
MRRAQRHALGDATNRANLPAQGVEDPSAALKPQKPAAAKPSAAAAAAAAAAAPAASRKRKSETSLEDDIAAYKQDLSDKYYLYDDAPDATCNQVRGKINKLIDSGIMKKVEFCKATHLSSKNLSDFLSKKGTYGGSGCTAYHSAWMWFKQRELAGLKMPDVKKRQKRDADAAAAASASTAKSGGASAGAGAGAGAASTTKPGPAASTPDISNIELEGEETDEVEVYDTCDEIRRKINAHLLKTPGLTQTQFCRDLYAQLRAPKCKAIQTKQLSDFRGQKGSRTGARSTVFYAAYVYFEKLRIAEGKPKSKHRLIMEDIWEPRGGFDREHDHRTSFIVMAGSQPTVDQYGQMHCF